MFYDWASIETFQWGLVIAGWGTGVNSLFVCSVPMCLLFVGENNCYCYLFFHCISSVAALGGLMLVLVGQWRLYQLRKKMHLPDNYETNYIELLRAQWGDSAALGMCVFLLNVSFSCTTLTSRHITRDTPGTNASVGRNYQKALLTQLIWRGLNCIWSAKTRSIR